MSCKEKSANCSTSMEIDKFQIKMRKKEGAKTIRNICQITVLYTSDLHNVMCHSHLTERGKSQEEAERVGSETWSSQEGAIHTHSDNLRILV